MLTAIEITNFKGIGDTIRIPIRPITLLFGANSTGKSTIIHALHLAYEILVNGNFDPDITEKGGDGINLGGFRNFVHNRDLDRQVVLAFELDMSDVDLRTYGAPENIDISEYVDTAKVIVTMGWSDLDNCPMPIRYRVDINGQFASELSQPNGPKQNTFFDYDITHPVLKRVFGDDVEESFSPWIPIQISNLRTVLPKWGHKLEYAQDTGDEYLEYGDHVASQVLVSVGEVFCDYLKKFRHIGPIREMIPRNFEGLSSMPESRWYNGLGAWDRLLHSTESDLGGLVSGWLYPSYRLNAGYGLNLYDTRSSNVKGILNSDRSLMARQPRVRLVNPGTDREFTLQDVGVGLSQLIPVVACALSRSTRIMAVEQPELHVHPQVQVGLGDLFASQIQRDCLFLIETHSEHLILRLLRRIREAYEGEVSDHAPELNHGDVSILFFESQNDEMKVTNIGIDETGEFTKRWPTGFFDERAEELF